MLPAAARQPRVWPLPAGPPSPHLTPARGGQAGGSPAVPAPRQPDGPSPSRARLRASARCARTEGRAELPGPGTLPGCAQRLTKPSVCWLPPHWTTECRLPSTGSREPRAGVCPRPVLWPVPCPPPPASCRLFLESTLPSPPLPHSSVSLPCARCALYFGDPPAQASPLPWFTLGQEHRKAEVSPRLSPAVPLSGWVALVTAGPPGHCGVPPPPKPGPILSHCGQGRMAAATGVLSPLEGAWPGSGFNSAS